MGKIFNNSIMKIDEMIEYIKEKTNGLAPVIYVTKAVIGNDTIMILVSFTPKSEWKHGYVENSQYFRMSIESNGEMECFTYSLYKPNMAKSMSTRLSKFRKSTVNSKELIIDKLVKYINKIKSEMN